MLRRTSVTDQLTGAEFNDYDPLYTHPLGLETEETKLDFASQVCAEHTEQFNLADGLDEEMGTRTCGVVGCERPAIHNYYFFSETDPLSVLEGEPKRKVKVTRTAAAPPTTLKGLSK